MNNNGKRAYEWELARKRLKKLFLSYGIVTCELQLEGCIHDNFLSFAHRRKRVEYYSEPEKLFDPNEVVLACQNCHQKIEVDPELTEKMFSKLRPEDGIPVERKPQMAKPKVKETTDSKQPKSKKADWMKPHACKKCKRHNSGFLICPYCKELSI